MPLVQNTVNFTQPYVQPVIQRATPVIQSSMGSISAGVGYVQQIPQHAQTHVARAPAFTSLQVQRPEICKYSLTEAVIRSYLVTRILSERFTCTQAGLGQHQR